MPRSLVFLFAIASGLAVANCYYAQLLLDAIANDFGISIALAGSVVTSTQIGYAIGLILLVPLGDLLDRKHLVIGMLVLAAMGLAGVAVASNSMWLLGAMASVGVVAVLAQILVAYAAVLAGPARQGAAVASVTTGIIIGILLARAVAGVFADLFGWRSIYWVSALATLVAAGCFLAMAPNSSNPSTKVPYWKLIASIFLLLRDEPLLRVRAVLAFFIFATISLLLTPMVLPLGAPPYSMSRAEIGLFGFAGVAGVCGAAFAGKMADRGLAQRATGIALWLMLMSWALTLFLPRSLLPFILGILIMDFGLQTVHVSNQSLIYPLRAEAKSRLVAAYMIFYSLGIAAGSVTSTLVYAAAGWTGVCVTGATLCAAGLVFWAGTFPSAARAARVSIATIRLTPRK